MQIIMKTFTHLPPPGPKGAPIIGSARALLNDRLGFLQHIAHEYGDLVHFRAVGRDFYLVNRPEWIRQVLVDHQHDAVKGVALQRAKRLLGNGLLTNEGDAHLKQRRLMQPLFHRDRIAGYAETMAQHAERLSADWHQRTQAADSVLEIDMAKEMTQLTLSIVAKTLFGADIHQSQGAQIGEAMDVLMRNFTRLMNPLAPLLLRLPLPAQRQMRAAEATLNKVIYGLITERRASPSKQHDLLSLLIQTTDEEGRPAMNDQQVRDEAMTLFLAGHETTANALAWAWYLLAQHPEVEKRLRTEIETVLQERTPSMDDVPKLIYTRRVFSEVLRLYPPAHTVPRLLVRDMTLGGHVLPKGATILVSEFVTHRDERFYPQPERFDPDRWLPEIEATRPKFAFFPFGAGTRQCIGEQFAWMEGVLCLAVLVRDWHCWLANTAPAILNPAITLRPKHGLKMKVMKLRHD